MTDYLLIYPPIVATGLNGPPLGIQHLAHYCEMNGLRGYPVDANIIFLRELLSDSSLNRIANYTFDYRHLAEIQSYLKISEVERLKVCRTFEPILHIIDRLTLASDDLERRIFLYQQSTAWNALRTTFRSLQPRWVGISILSYSQLSFALYIAREFKKVDKEIKIVLGGSELGGWTDERLRNLLALAEVDHVVVGSGESAFVNLIKGTVKSAKVEGAAISLSQIPIKASFQIDPSSYLAPQLYNVVESSGCYWNKCTHCDYIALHPEVDFTRPIEELVDELDVVQRNSGISRFHLINETLAPSRARRLAEAVIKKGSSIKWNCFVKIDRRFTEDILRMLPAGGCEFLIIGLESLSDRALNILDKGYTAEEAKAWLLIARNAGVKLILNFIVGIPGTTREDELDTIAWLEENPHFSLNCKVYKFVLSRISAMGRSPDKYGLIPIVQSPTPAGHRGGSSIAVEGNDDLEMRYVLFCEDIRKIQNRARRPALLTNALLQRSLGGSHSNIEIKVAPWLTYADCIDQNDNVIVVFDGKSGRSIRFLPAYRTLVTELMSSQEITVGLYIDRPDRVRREEVLLSFAEAGFISLLAPDIAMANQPSKLNE